MGDDMTAILLSPSLFSRVSFGRLSRVSANKTKK